MNQQNGRLEAADGLNKTLKLLPGLHHDIYHEPERREVMDLVLDWLERHLA